MYVYIYRNAMGIQNNVYTCMYVYIYIYSICVYIYIYVYSIYIYNDDNKNNMIIYIYINGDISTIYVADLCLLISHACFDRGARVLGR